MLHWLFLSGVVYIIVNTLIGQSAGYSAGQNVVAVGTKSAYRIGIESTAIGMTTSGNGQNTIVGHKLKGSTRKHYTQTLFGNY